MKALQRILLTALFGVILHASDASAIIITTSFAGGTPPVNAVGAGNLTEIVNAAARIWEAAYADAGLITIKYGWAPVGDAGTHTLIEQGGFPNREVIGLVLFDNSGSVPYFLDPTPYSNEEYRRRTEEYQDLGGGLMNVSRVLTSPVGNAAGHIDLLSVALHEIGHAMGMCMANSAFTAIVNQGEIRIAAGMPFAGSEIPLASNNAGFTSHFDSMEITYGSVMAGLCGDERRIPSALDILANAQVSGYKNLNLDAAASLLKGASSRGAGAADNNAASRRNVR